MPSPIVPPWLHLDEIRKLRASLPSSIQYPCLKASAYQSWTPDAHQVQTPSSSVSTQSPAIAAPGSTTNSPHQSNATSSTTETLSPAPNNTAQNPATRGGAAPGPESDPVRSSGSRAQPWWGLCENLQVSGSYKVRAACHLARTWKEQHQQQYPRGVALASSGNFASAIAWAGRELGVPTAVVMMEKSSPFKANKAASLGAEIYRCGNHTNDRVAKLQSLAHDGWWCVDHMESQEVIQAHATLGLDLITACLAQGLTPDRVLVPVSTAGLLAGVAVAVKQQFPNVKIIGLQSSTSQAAAQSFQARDLVQLENTQTICDALTANRPGRLPMQICWDWVDQLETVDDEKTQQSVLELLQQEHLLVEPGAAITHAYLKSRPEDGLMNVLVLSGGNLDPKLLADWIQKSPS